MIVNNRPIPRNGEVYRHFKGDEYRVIGMVINANNDEREENPQVLYIREDDMDKIVKRFYRRRIDEFLSPIDRDKYPDAKQYWRFEKVDYNTEVTAVGFEINNLESAAKQCQFKSNCL